MDLSFIEKFKIVFDIVTNKQNQKSGEDIFNRYRDFLKDIKEIENDSNYDTDDKEVLKNLRVGALTGAGKANYKEFLFFKEIFANDMLLINYWSFVRNRSVFEIDNQNNEIRVKFWPFIRAHLFYLGLIFILVIICTSLALLIFNQLTSIEGELSLSLTISTSVIGIIMAFLIITIFRLFFEHTYYSSLCNQVKSLK
ncbi:hypothetical protein ACT4YI_16855 [Acinetobacter baumannii]